MTTNPSNTSQPQTAPAKPTRTNLRLPTLLTILLLTTCPPAKAATLNVPADYPTIQSAIDAATTGDIVEIANGTYTGPGNKNLDFNGKAITVRSASNDPNLCIIDCQNNGRAFCFHSNESHAATVQGVTITNGYVGRSSQFSNSGGAVLCISASNPNFQNCRFISNAAFHDGCAGPPCGSGGAVYAYYSCPVFNNCTFSRNSASEAGGAVACSGSHAWFINCAFTGNSARSGGATSCEQHSDATYTNCTIVGNSSETTGGGISADRSNPFLTNCIIWNNDAPTGSQLHASQSDVTVANSCVEAGWPGIGNINDDPLLVDADGPDDEFGTVDDNLHISLSSPCIDAGDNDSLPNQLLTDFDGEDRIQYCRVDMGVDETCFDAADCNGNDSPDGCDLAYGTSADCNNNAVPDECEATSPSDCNNNGLTDLCDIYAGTSHDCNRNGLPDECEPFFEGLIYVDSDATAGMNDGSSWNDAYLQLDHALLDAECRNQITEIRVAEGTYKPLTQTIPGTPRTATFVLINGVAIRGGYAGLSAHDPNLRDPTLYETILSGDLAGNDQPEWGNREDNVYNVVTANNNDQTATIDGLTVTGGSADSRRGGGMAIFDGQPTILQCTFEDNSAYSGGGLSNTNAAPTIFGCTFAHNSANTGGGISNYHSSPTIIDCDFFGNYAKSTGGGMADDYHCSPTLINCAFTENSADGHGGAIYSKYYSAPTMLNCTLVANSAGYTGGAIASSTHFDQTVAVTNCAFIANSAQSGGALDQYSGNLQLTNSVFTQNSAINGGGMHIRYTTSVLSNCIFWNNSANEDPQIACVDCETTATFNCIQGGSPDQGNIDQNPAFLRLPDDGGDGWLDDPSTLDFDESANNDYGNLGLSPNSPCIDAGSNGAVPVDSSDLDNDGNTTELTPLDLDGRPRFLDDPQTPDTGQPLLPTYPHVVDMGAYEYRPQNPADLDHDGTVDDADFAIFLLAFGSSTGHSSYNPDCDYDNDGMITFVDYQLWLQHYRSDTNNPTATAPTGTPGDFDADQDIDLADFAILQTCFPDSPKTFFPCSLKFDFNNDHQVDLHDLSLFQEAMEGP